MVKGGGGMSHRRHRLVRGMPDRKKILQQTARELDRQVAEAERLKAARKEPLFGSVREAFEASRKKR